MHSETGQNMAVGLMSGQPKKAACHVLLSELHGDILRLKFD